MQQPLLQLMRESLFLLYGFIVGFYINLDFKSKILITLFFKLFKNNFAYKVCFLVILYF